MKAEERVSFEKLMNGRFNPVTLENAKLPLTKIKYLRNLETQWRPTNSLSGKAVILTVKSIAQIFD